MNQFQDLANVADRLRQAIQSARVMNHLIRGDETFPNNEKLSLLVYQSALNLPRSDPATIVEELFELNGWSGSWRNGIYGFHHYHSTAHEVLGVYSGSAEVRLGGNNGVSLTIDRGDVIIIPAGVAHKNLGSSSNFRVVGAYPQGQGPDMCYGKAGERPRTDHNIAKVQLPQKDPVYGTDGPLKAQWKKND